MRAYVMLMMLALQLSGIHASEEFLSTPWGTPSSQVREKYELREISRDAHRVMYSSTIRRLGNAELAECNLEFVRDRFAGAVILTKGRSDSDELLQFLTARFGAGQRVDRTAICWIAGDVHVSYDTDRYGDAYVYWYSLRHQ
jgi:hypothetical protein